MNNLRLQQGILNRIGTFDNFCALIFAVFSFCYCCFYQNDIWAATIYKLLGVSWTYADGAWALLITLLLVFLQRQMYKKRFQGKDKHLFLSFIPSLLTLIVLSNFSLFVLDLESRFGISIFLIGHYLVYVKKEKNKEDDKSIVVMTYYQHYKTLLLMGAYMFTVCVVANTKDTTMYSLRMERHILQGEYDKALSVGKRSLSNDSTLLALRVYSLLQEGKLGERLFDYPIAPFADIIKTIDNKASAFILPSSFIQNYLEKEKKLLYQYEQNKGMVSRTSILNNAYLNTQLAKFLMNKDLAAFVATIDQYGLTSQRLPKHYSEALILYNHLTSQPKVSFKNNVLDTDYEDFQSLKSKYTHPMLRNNCLRDVYGNTYWYYYYCL